MTLSLCMIVKNEARWIRQCLKSVRGLADQIVVIDTGSSDGTDRMAQEEGAEVHTFAWENDFSKARNASLERATGDWILVLDADESLDAKACKSIREIVARPDSRLYTLIQTTYCQDSATFGWIPNRLNVPEAKDYPGYLESRLTRLFKNDPDIRFTGIIHEHAGAGPEEKPIDTDIRIHHFGKYADDAVKAQKDDLYLALGQEKCRQRPKDFHAWYELGIQLWGMGRYAEAKDAMSESLALHSNNTRAHVALAALHAVTKDLKGAVIHYARVLKIDPSNPMPYLQLPPILAELGKIEEAMGMIRLGEQVAGGQPSFQINRGIVEQSAGDHLAAIASFDRALQLNPGESIARLNKGISQMALGDWKGATASLRTASFDPACACAARKKIAETFFMQGRYDDALGEVRALAALRPDDVELKYQECVIAYKQGRLDDARELLRSIRDLTGFSGQALKTIEQCHRAVGNADEARAVQELIQQHGAHASAAR